MFCQMFDNIIVKICDHTMLIYYYDKHMHLTLPFLERIKHNSNIVTQLPTVPATYTPRRLAAVTNQLRNVGCIHAVIEDWRNFFNVNIWSKCKYIMESIMLSMYVLRKCD